MQLDIRHLRFEALAVQWKNDTRFSSFVDMIVSHQAYREIVAMGDAALPFIMEEQAAAPHHWHAALVEITDYDPVPEEARGDLDLMAQSWLEWWDRRTGCARRCLSQFP
jgi:hypothetical protein